MSIGLTLTTKGTSLSNSSRIKICTLSSPSLIFVLKVNLHSLCLKIEGGKLMKWKNGFSMLTSQSSKFYKVRKK